MDICGPSVPKLTGLENQEIHRSNLGWSPVYVEDNLAVMSIGFLLPNPDDAVIWRGPRKKFGLIKQFLKVSLSQHLPFPESLRLAPSCFSQVFEQVKKLKVSFDGCRMCTGESLIILSSTLHQAPQTSTFP